MYSHLRNGTGVKYFSQMKKIGNRTKPSTSMPIMYPVCQLLGAYVTKLNGSRKMEKAAERRKIPTTGSC
jgi:hypothetical protein